MTASVNNGPTFGKVIFEINPPKEIENSPAAFARTLLALTQIRRAGFLERFSGNMENISLEIGSIDAIVHFYAIVPIHLANHFEAQIAASYPKAGIGRLENDYVLGRDLANLFVKELVLAGPFYLPIKTYKTEKDVDPLASVLGTLAKVPDGSTLIFQLNLAHGGKWQGVGRKVIQRGIPTLDEEGKTKYAKHPQAGLIEEKISQQGFEVSLRLASAHKDREVAASNLTNLLGAFGSFAVGEGNSLRLYKPIISFRNDLAPGFFLRNITPFRPHQYLNVDEVATLWHLPDNLTSQIKNISWGGQGFNDPPQNLPVVLDATDEEKQQINFFAETEFKNQKALFGIRNGEDRRRHFYIIGKTGTGKSTLIANMAISDIKKGYGVGIIDPHGDLSDIILDYIPESRIEDVIYLDPSISDRTFHLNPFEVGGSEQGDIVTSNFVAIFQKLYDYSWGPRLEYILRNTVLTLVKRRESTMLDIPKILTDTVFRREAVAMVQDPVLRNFWVNEFNQYSEKFKQEAVAPILNKVGQFLSSIKIRSIVGHPKSTLNLSEIMDQGKILILNLTQGKIGQDNAALLGAMFITKFELAASGRANLPSLERRDFFLYVDEFQNFATTSFIKILSEARKYRLNLILANQYMAQLSEEIQKAIFGNVGSIVSFVVGAADAAALTLEFGKSVTPEELVALSRFKVAVKLSIDQATCAPFFGHTLPLPESLDGLREQVMATSLAKYTRPLEKEVPPPSRTLETGGESVPADVVEEVPFSAQHVAPAGQSFPAPARPHSPDYSRSRDFSQRPPHDSSPRPGNPFNHPRNLAKNVSSLTSPRSARAPSPK